MFLFHIVGQDKMQRVAPKGQEGADQAIGRP